MSSPFTIREDGIRDRELKSQESIRWVENVQPLGHEEIAYLKPSLKSRRFSVVLAITLGILFLLAARAAQLQIVRHDQYANAADINRVRIIRAQASRGTIADRNNIALTKNVPRFQLVVNPLDIPRDPETRRDIIATLNAIGELPPNTLEEELRRPKIPSTPLILKTNLTAEELYPLLITAQDVPGVTLETISAREYVYGPLFSHTIGYMGKIEENQKALYLKQNYRLNDLVGKTGLETRFEEFLHGRDGRTYVEVDAAGRIQRTVASEEAIPGNTLRLTIDRDLQEKAQNTLAEMLDRTKTKKGTVIVMDPSNGEILALVSLPTFDGNLLTTKKDAAAVAELFNNPDQPLFNRAIAGTYPSGSTIKPAVAAAALQEGVITKNTTVFSSGGLRIGQWFFPDWKAGGHGIVNVKSAIANSVNTFFYTIGGGYGDQKGLGATRLGEYLRAFHFNVPTGIELDGEASGFVPTPDWKLKIKGEPWYIGDTYHLAIGQGDFLTTPLQIARMTAYFASSGKWTTPHLALPPLLTSPRAGEEAKQFLPLTKGEFEGVSNGPQIDPQHMETVRQGMRETVLAGSARSLQTLSVSSAGKTGTAQWHSSKPTHAWFTGFAPYDNPKLAITVLIEQGGEGSAAALPVAKEIMRWWFAREQNAQNTAK